MTIDRDTQFSDLNSNSSFYDWFTKENQEIIAKLNQINTFTVEGVNGITAPININGKASIGLSGKVDIGISFNGPAYFNAFAAIPNIAMRVNEINSVVGGFTFGTPVRVYYDTATSSIKYEAARGNDPDQAEVLGVVSEINATHSYVTMLGKIDGDFSAVNARGIGLTAGWIYFLDPGVTGDITDIEPVATGYVSKPVIMGITGNSGMVLQMRGNFINPIITSAGITGSNIIVLETTPSANAFTVGTMISMASFSNSTEEDAFITYLLPRRHYVNLNTTNPAFTGIFESGTSTTSYPEGDYILGLIVDVDPHPSIGSAYIITVLVNGFTTVLGSEYPNGTYYLNPENSTSTQYGTEYSSSGHIVFHKISNYAIVNSKSSITGSGGALTDRAYYIGASGASGGLNQGTNYLVNGNFAVWQRDSIGKHSAFTSDGNSIFADMWRRHDDVTGSSSTKNYQILRQEFDDYQSEIEGNPQHYINIKALGVSALGISGTSGGYTAYDHLMIGHVIPGAKRFDLNNLNIKFYAKSSMAGYDLDVYLSRYNDTTLLDYTKLGSINLGTNWAAYTMNSTIPALENNGNDIVQGNDYCEVGLDFIPLMEKAIQNGLTLSANLTVSLSSFVATIGTSIPTAIFEDYPEQLKYAQQFYFSTFDKDQLSPSITMTDTTTPTQNSENIFMLPNKNNMLYKWPVRMRESPNITFYSPYSGVMGAVYNKTAGFDTYNTSGVGGRDGSSASITANTSVHGAKIEIYNGFITYDDLYFHVIADADFAI